MRPSFVVLLVVSQFACGSEPQSRPDAGTQPGPALKGRVLQAAALAPAAGAVVRLVGTPFETRAGADGRFAFEQVPGAVWTVAATFDADGDGAVEQAAHAVVDASANADLGDLLVAPLGAIEGVVTMGDAPVEGVRVVWPLLADVLSGAGGTFRLAGLPPGTGRLFVEVRDANGTVLHEGPEVQLAAGETKTLELAVGEAVQAGRVQGTARVFGASGNDRVEVRLSGTSSSDLPATDPDGGTESGAVPGGLYTAVARRAGLASVVLPLVVVDGDTTLPTMLLVTDDCVSTGNCSVSDADVDGDAVVDVSDNCPGTANPQQEDADSDGVGDACRPVLPEQRQGCPCSVQGVLPGGRLEAAAVAVLEPPNAGVSEGAFDSASGTLLPGAHHFDSFTVSSDTTVAGDLTLDVDGPVTVGAGTYVALTVSGDLTIRAAGPVKIMCAAVFATGRVRVHQGSAEPLEVACPQSSGSAYLATKANAEGGTGGGIEVVTRGSVVVRGASYIMTGNMTSAGATLETGGIRVVAAEDVLVDTRFSYFIVGDSNTRSGDVEILAGRHVKVTDKGNLILGRNNGFANVGGALSVRARGDVDFSGGALYPHRTSRVDVVAGGTFLANRASMSGGVAGLSIAAQAISVNDGGWLASIVGGPLSLSAPGNVELTGGSGVEPGGAQCADRGSGDVSVTCGGDLSLLGGSRIGGAGTSACPDVPGGDVSLRVRGIITTDATAVTDVVSGGRGTPAGETTIVAGDATLVVPEAGARFGVASVAQSGPLTVVESGLRVTGVELVGATPADLEAHVLVSASGDEGAFVPWRLAGPLADGWRWKVELHGGLFEAAVLEGVRFTVE